MDTKLLYEREMASKGEEITRGKELFIRHIYLFGKAVPLTIKAAIRKIVEKKGQPLKTILTDKKKHIRTFYTDLYKVLFKESYENIDEQIDSWDITTLCDIALVLTEQPNVDCIKCILDQRRDLKNYLKNDSIDYQTFKMKDDALKESLLQLLKDTDATIECKSLIFSFDETRAIQLRNEVHKSLKLTEDLDNNLEVVSKCASSSDLHPNEKTEENIAEAKNQTKNVDEEVETGEFVQNLSDTIVRAGDTSVLVCKLNMNNCHVVWSKNGEVLKESNMVYPLADKGRHCLVFTKAMPEESGTYKCTYKNTSTSASLIILEQDVAFEKELHSGYSGDIKEYMKVQLSCIINLPMKTPRWFHNSKEIEASNGKTTIVSTDYEHKLIIDSVELHDSGDYMVVFDGVTSKTSLTIKGHRDLTIKQQIKQKLYKNWLIGVLGLKYLKTGLEIPAAKAIKRHHEYILKSLPKSLSNEKCSECNVKNLLPLHDKKHCPRTQHRQTCLCFKSLYGRRQCPRNELCSKIYDMIVRDHRYEDPAMRNTRMHLWKNDPWSVAACYISNTEFTHTSVYRYKTSSKELDCAELLSLFVNNKIYLENTNYGIFDMARNHRNELMHNPNYEISDDKLCEYLKDFRDVLEVKNDSSKKMIFGKYPKVYNSLKALKELQQIDLAICTREKLEKLKNDVRDSALNEAAKKLQDAMRQKDEEFQQMQDILQSDCHNPIENMCRKHNGTENSWICITHGKLICKSCKEKEHRLCSGLMKLEKTYKDVTKISFMHKDSREILGKLISICTLPEDECLVLLEQPTRKANNLDDSFELCKLDKTYSPISKSTLTYRPRGMCYKGDNNVVSTDGHRLVFIDLADLQIIRHLEVNCFLQGLACHGDNIYTCDGKSVLVYDTEETRMHILCTLPDMERDVFPQKCKLAVSNDGESIYCLRISDMYKIDSRKNEEILLTFDLKQSFIYQHTTLRDSFRSSLLETYKPKDKDEVIVLGKPLCICCNGCSHVIICDDKGNVLKFNDSGSYVVSKIPSIQKVLFSACFDPTTSKLNVGDEDGIHIFEVCDL